MTPRRCWVSIAYRLDAQIEQRGLWAVVGLRPGISDALASYAFRGVRSSVVANGRWVVHRVGATGVRLHRAGRRLITNLSSPLVLLGVRGVVRDRHHRGVNRAAFGAGWRARPRRRCGLAQLDR